MSCFVHISRLQQLDYDNSIDCQGTSCDITKCHERFRYGYMVRMRANSIRWDQGLLDMCIGDKRTLDIPASLAYGANRGIGSCKADCELRMPSPSLPFLFRPILSLTTNTTVFDTELMGIEGVSKETASPPVEEPVKQEPPVSARQNGLDHLILAFVGVLIVASVGMAFLWWRGRRGVKYQVLGQRNA